MRVWFLLALGLLLAQACAAEVSFGTHKGEEAVNKKVEHERAVAHQSAVDSEREVAKLNSEVFPSERKAITSRWHHESSKEIQEQWQRTVASTMGVDPTASVHFGHPHKAAAAHKETQAHGKGKAAHGKKAPAHAPHKPTAREEAAAEEKADAKLSAEVLPQDKPGKWHTESSEAELSHLAAVAGKSLPAEKKMKVHTETAAQMQAENKKETDSTFPKRWAKQEKKAQVVGKVDYHKKAMQKKEEIAGAKAFGHHTYRKMDLQSKLQANEDETKSERAVADKAAKKELSHLNKLNSEVFPTEPVHKKLKSVQKHAIHKEAMHNNKKHQATSQKMHTVIDPHHPMSSKNRMPPSSDEPTPAAGTNVAYMGAPQGGYAKGKAPVHHKNAKKEKRAAKGKAVTGKK